MKSRFTSILLSTLVLLCVTLFSARAEVILDEGFENITSGIPAGWDNADGTTTTASYKWTYYSDASKAHTGSKCLRFNSYTNSNGRTNALKTPSFAANQDLIFSFWYKNPTGGDLSVCISTDGGATYTTVLEALPQVSSYTYKEYALSDYTGQQNLKIVWFSTSNYGNGDAYHYLDDVLIETAPSCAKPTNLSFSELNQSSVKVSWANAAAGATPSAWQITVLKAEDNSVVMNRQTINPVSTEYTITGLQPSTEYKVRLRGDCTADYLGFSDESDYVNFSTLCPAISLPYSEDFEALADNQLPSCWIFKPSAATVTLGASTAVHLDGSTRSLKYYAPANENGYFVIAQLSTPANALEIELNINIPSLYSSDSLGYAIGLMSDPTDPATFEPIKSGMLRYADRGQWFNVLTNTAQSVYGAQTGMFAAVSFFAASGSRTVYIDDLSIHAPATCPRLDNLAVMADSTSARFTWEEAVAAAAYQVMLKDANNVVSYVILNNGVASGLTPNMEYTANIRAICGAGDTSAWMPGTITFKTICGVMPSAIYTEGFEEVITPYLPDCYVASYLENPYGYPADEVPFISTTVAHSGTKGAALRDRQRGTRSQLILPAFVSETPNKYIFSIWVYRNTTSSDDEGLVAYWNNAPEIDTTKVLGAMCRGYNQPPVATSSGWYQYEFPIPSQGVTYIILKGISHYGQQTSFDDIEIELAPTCFKPGAVTVKGANKSMSVKVAPDQFSNNYVAVYKFDNETDSVRVEFNDSLSFTGLQPASTYRIAGRMARICGAGDTSKWVTFAGTHTTPCETVPVDETHRFFEGFEGFQNNVAISRNNSCYWTESSSTSKSLKAKSSPINTSSCQTPPYAGNMACYNTYVSNQVLFALVHLYAGKTYTMSVQGFADCEDTYVQFWYGQGETSAELTPLLTGNGFSLPGTCTWTEVSTTFSVAADGDYTIAVGINETCDNWNNGLDNWEVRIDNCAGISQLGVSNVTDNSALLTFSSSATQWEVIVDTVAIDVDNVPATGGNYFLRQTINDTSFNITSLSGQTTYYYAVRTICDPVAEVYSYWSAGYFATPCDAYIVDENQSFFEGFESYPSGTELSLDNSCRWQQHITGSENFQVRTTPYTTSGGRITPYAGDQALYSYYLCHNVVFASVQLYAGKTYEMSVWGASDCSREGTYVQMYYGQGQNITTLTPLIEGDGYSIQGTNTWEQAVAVFEVPQDGVYTIAVGIEETCNWYNNAIDSWRLRVLNCATPSSFSMSQITSNSATLSFVSDATSWEIIIDTTVIDVDNIPETGGNYFMRQPLTGTTGNVLSPLNPNTTYYFAVRGICAGGNSDWSSVYRFSTTCAPSNLPYYQGFEPTEDVSCWRISGEGSAYLVSNRYRGGSRSIRLNNIQAISPELNVTSLAPYQISGFVYPEADTASFAIGVSVDPTDVSTFEIVQDVTGLTKGQWQEFTAYFSLLNDPDYEDFQDARFVTIVVSGGADYYFDDITIEAIPTCAKPTLLRYQSVNPNDVTLSWTEPGAATSWKVQAFNVDSNRVDLVQVVNSNPCTINGLQPSTRYIFNVASICGAGDTSSYAVGTTVRTPCAAIALPYMEGFETVTAANLAEQCFTTLTDGTVNAPAVYTSNANNGTNSFALKATSTGQSYLILPKFAAATNTLIVSFAYNNTTTTSTYYPSLTIGVMSNPSDPSTFEALQTYPKVATYTTASYDLGVLPASYANYYIAFRAEKHTSTSNYNALIDDIVVTTGSGCSVPQSLEVKAVGESTATIQFRSQSAAFEYAAVAGNGSVEYATPVSFASTNFTITGLASHTTYNVYVRAVCDNNEVSDWSAPVQFTTECASLIALPYSEPFNTGTIEINTCVTAVGTSLPKITDGTGYMSSAYPKSLCFTAKPADRGFVLLPQLDCQLSNIKMSFVYGFESTANSGDIIVGYVTDVTDVEGTFTSVYTITAQTTSEALPVVIDFSTLNIPATAQNARVAIGTTVSPASSSYYWSYINNLLVENGLVCPMPEAISIDNIQDSSAVANWTYTSAGTYVVQLLSADGNVLVTSTPRTSTSFNLDNLTPNTLYKVRVASLCGANDTSAWVTTTFRTLAPFATVPYTVDFESAEKDCWRFANGVNFFTVGSLDGNTALFVTNDSTSFAYTDNRPSISFATRRITLPSDTSFDITFRWKGGMANDDYARLFIVPTYTTITAGTPILNSIQSSNGTAVAIDGGVLTGTCDWTTVRARLDRTPATTTSYYLVAQWVNNSENGGTGSFAIDDISITFESCIPAATITPNTHSAQFSFNGYQSVEYKVTADEAGANIVKALTTVTTGVDSVINLNSNTTYYLIYRVQCSATETSAWKVQSFKTPYEMKWAPYATDFEDATLDGDWMFENGPNHFVIGSGTALGGTRSLYITEDGATYGYEMTNGSVSYAMLPLNFENKTYRFQYDWRSVGEGSFDYAHVALVPFEEAILLTGAATTSAPTGISSTNIPSSWLRIEQNDPQATPTAMSANPNLTHVQQERSITAGQYAFVVMWRNDGSLSNGDPFVLDNLSITALACPSPSVEILSAKDSTAVIRVVNGSDDPTTYVAIDTVAANLATYTAYTAAVDTIRVNNLVPGKPYTIYYFASCNAADTLSTQFATAIVSRAPLYCDFETVTDAARWSFISSATNRYVIGAAATAQNGGSTKSLYITNNGADYTYTANSAVPSTFAYMPLDLEANRYIIEYDYQCIGESSYDYARVALAPLSDMATLTAGSTVFNKSNIPAGWIALDNEGSNPYFSGMSGQAATWNHISRQVTLRTGEYALVLMWANDASDSYGPPMAFDNLTIIGETCPMPQVEISTLESDTVHNGKAYIAGTITVSTPTDIYYALSTSPAKPHDSLFTLAANATTVSFMFDNLTRNQTVYVYAYAQCTTTDRSQVAVESIRIPLGEAQRLPFSTDFTDASDNAKWTILNDEYNQFIFGSNPDACLNSNTSLYVSSNGSTYEYSGNATSYIYAYRTIMISSGASVDVEYDWKCEGESTYDYGRLFLAPDSYTFEAGAGEFTKDGVMRFISYSSNPDDFIALDIYGSNRKLSESSQWSHYTATINVPVGGIYNLVVMWRNDGSIVYQPGLSIDNISIANFSLTPTSVIAKDITTTSATIKWVVVDSSYNYQVKVEGPNGVVLNQVFDALTDSVVLNPILASSNYSVSVQTLRGSEYGRVARTTFATLCDVVNVPYLNNFDSYTTAMPNCFESTSTANFGSKWALSNGEMVATAAASQAVTYTLTTPEFAFPATGDYRMRFNYELLNVTANSHDTLEVRVVDATNNETRLVAYATTTTASTRVSLSMAAYKGQTVSFKFVLKGGGLVPANAKIDNFMIVADGGEQVFYATICNDEDYIGHGFNVSRSKLIVGENLLQSTSEITDVNDLDVTTTVYVTRLPELVTELSDVSCAGQPYTSFGFNIPNPRAQVYTRYETSSNGCDSTIRLTLDVAQTEFTESAVICEGDSYQFAGRTLTVAGVYADTAQSSRGCDSITTLTLQVEKTQYYDSAYVCNGTYYWALGDQTLSVTGDYTHNATSTNGCTITYHMHFEVLPTEYEQEAWICQGGSLEFGGEILTEAGTYNHTWSRYNYECDSTVILTLHVNPAPVYNLADYVCEGDDYEMMGFNVPAVQKDTIVERTVKTLDGCDSIVRLTLTVAPSYDVEISATINDGESYTFGGNTYTTAGDYTRHFYSEFGCDSTVTLHLSVEGVGVENAYMLPVVLAPNPIRSGTSSYVVRDWSVDERNGMQVYIYAATGAMVKAFDADEFPIHIDGIHESGVYYVRILSGDGTWYVGKLIVK